jgi:hypothetical protein
MKTFKIAALILSLILITYNVYVIKQTDASFAENKFHYLNLVALLLVAVSFLLGVIKDRYQK